MKKLLLVGAFAMLSSACSIKSHYIQSNAQTYPSTNISEIKVYASSEVLENYTVIGSVVSFVQGNGEHAITELKKEAAVIGADAIIALKLDKLNSFSQATEASGIAVKINL